MSYYLKRKTEILAMQNPHEALVAASTDRGLTLTELEDILESYSKEHGTTVWDMSWDEETGDRVLQPEMFWE